MRRTDEALMDSVMLDATTNAAISEAEKRAKGLGPPIGDLRRSAFTASRRRALLRRDQIAQCIYRRHH
jgi:hypothetical protein